MNSEVHWVRAQNLGARSCEKRRREVSRLHLRETWQNHMVGPGSGPEDRRQTFGGGNTPLTSCVLGT
jgi:hypothetical protein